MSDLYFKQKCEHELNDTLCDTKCEAYIGGEGWYLVLADGDLLTRAEWEASIDRNALYAAFNEMEGDVTLAQYEITDRLIAAIEGDS